MNNYFKTVTLGAFTGKNPQRITLLLVHIKKTGFIWFLTHFLLISLCLNFPVMLSIVRLTPHELFSRLYGSESARVLPSAVREALVNSNAAETDSPDDFNSLMLQSGYGARILMPLLGLTFGLVLIIQAVFYVCAAGFLSVSRLHAVPLLFRDCLGLTLYSSTMPVLAASLFGLFIPTVHIIIFYFLVMYFIFQRSKLCPNG